MKILVDQHRETLCTVVLRPNLFERLVLRVREEERYAVRVRDIGGSYRWLWDHDFCPVDEAVERAIKREIAERHVVGGLA